MSPGHAPNAHRFAYSLLEPTSIRLLKVLSDDLDGRLQIHLYESELPAEYQCLSYMWGEPDAGHEILVNGRTYTVRSNLHSFLSVAASWFPDQALWIDAVCIDQDNVTERSHQVQRMGDIYRGAVRVIVWLGLDEGTDILFKSFTDSFNLEKIEFPAAELSAVTYSCILHPYWERAWIVQEVLLARTVVFRFLSREEDLTTLAERMRVLRRKTRNALNESDVGTDSILQKLCQNLSRPEEFSYMRDVAATADIDNENAVGSYHLWDIIHRHARTACWDSRDRIYSLLSLLKVGSDFEVRYEESRLDMFWRAGTYFNAWELDSQVAGLAETLSLGPLALLHHATVEDKGKIGLLFETAPFRIDAYLPDLPSTSSRFPTQKDKVIEVVQCGKVQQGHRCEISIQTQDDVLLCPCTQDGDPYLDHRRLHAVLSPKTEASGDVIAMSLFSLTPGPARLDFELWHFTRSKMSRVTRWSRVRQIMHADKERGATTFWVLKLPRLYAIDCMLSQRHESWAELLANASEVAQNKGRRHLESTQNEERHDSRILNLDEHDPEVEVQPLFLKLFESIVRKVRETISCRRTVVLSRNSLATRVKSTPLAFHRSVARPRRFRKSISEIKKIIRRSNQRQRSRTFETTSSLDDLINPQPHSAAVISTASTPNLTRQHTSSSNPYHTASPLHLFTTDFSL